MEAQFAELAANPDILVATPGRLLHHLEEVAGFSLGAVEYCVFDEADRLFEMGFAEQVGGWVGGGRWVGGGDAVQAVMVPQVVSQFGTRQ
jgi:hypothetical protein